MRERCARRDRSSSRVAAPHARATSRLTAPSPSPAPRVTANSPPRPRRRLASPSACARRYVSSRARTASEARWVVFDFPSRVFPARVVPRPRRRAKTPRVDRVDRSVHVRIARSAHRRSPFPTATGRSRSRGEGSRGEEARAHRPPSRLPGATLAATRPRLLRGPTSRRRRRFRIPEQTTRRRSGASSIARTLLRSASKAPAARAPRARIPADVSPSVPGGSAVVSRNRIVNAFRVSSCVHVEVAEGSDDRNPRLATRG